MAGDRPDWRKGTVAHRCTGGACPVSDVQDWNKVVMAYPPGDPQLTKDYEDWVHGTVYEEGSSACLYDCEKLLIHDIGEKTDNFTDEVVIDLTAEQAAWSGVLLQCALEQNTAIHPVEFYPRVYIDMDPYDYLEDFGTYYYNSELTTETYLEMIVCSDANFTLTVSDPINGGSEKTGNLAGQTVLTPFPFTEGEHTFTLDALLTYISNPGVILHFFKLYLIYSSERWGFARYYPKGQGGITW